MDDFETHLSRQTMRAAPRSWRDEILAEANSGLDDGKDAPDSPWWRLLFWPSPVVGSAVACAWVCIIGLNLASRPERPTAPATADFFARVVIAQHMELAAASQGPEPSPPEPQRQPDGTPDAALPRNSRHDTI